MAMLHFIMHDKIIKHEKCSSVLNLRFSDTRMYTNPRKMRYMYSTNLPGTTRIVKTRSVPGAVCFGVLNEVESNTSLPLPQSLSRSTIFHK